MVLVTLSWAGGYWTERSYCWEYMGTHWTSFVDSVLDAGPQIESLSRMAGYLGALTSVYPWLEDTSKNAIAPALGPSCRPQVQRLPLGLSPPASCHEFILDTFSPGSAHLEG